MAHAAPAERQARYANDGFGLTSREAAHRLAKFGPNDIYVSQQNAWVGLAADTAKDPMLWFLLATSAAFYAVGDVTEATVMLAAILPILGMDYYLHHRTASLTASLAGQLAPRACVVRDGEVQFIPLLGLVPGDLVQVETGEPFPADGIVVAGSGLQVDESTLTGESLPVRKTRLPVDGGSNLQVSDENWAMAGTRLLSGSAGLQVIETGAATLYGRIMRAAGAASHTPTALQQGVLKLVYLLSAAAIPLCVILALARLWQGHGWEDAFVSGVTLAVAALPEEFPVALAFFIGLGVYRLAQQKALVQRAAAVENIGRVTCVCSDKTGTVTEGKLSLAGAHGFRGASPASLLSLAAAAARAESTDALDKAIIAAAPGPTRPVAKVFPFTETRRREVIVRKAAAGFLIAMKGAPETVLERCRLSRAARAQAEAQLQVLTGLGRKVIAVASSTSRSLPRQEPAQGFALAGFLAFEDPVRPEVPDAIRSISQLGIRIILVTGDHEATARMVATKAGIGGSGPRVISGAGLSQHLAAAAGIDFDVVARADPLQKLELIKALQARGEVVAVTGDGVNDVPALHGADVSVAMGERGTAPARDAAMIVLLNDSFSTIAQAILEGRAIFERLRASFSYILTLHIPIVLGAAIVPLLGYPLLFLPVHIVILELVIHPTAILAFQSSQSFASKTGAPQRHKAILGWRDIAFTTASGLWLGLLVVLGFISSLGAGLEVLHARSFALSALVMASTGITWSLNRGRASMGAASLAAFIALFSILLMNGRVAGILQLAPLHLADIGLIGIAILPSMALAYLLRRPRAA